MPNWCENDLYIEGPEADVRGFLDFAQGQDEGEEMLLDFSKIVPEPATITIDMITEPWIRAMITEPDPSDLSYEWRLQYWGTKWQPDSARIEEEGVDAHDLTMRIKLVFCTAWSPPRPIILAASTMFANLDFDLRYFECGCGFNGWFRCKNGEVQNDESGRYFGDRGG